MPQNTFHIDEDEIYELIADELESGGVNKALWTKLFAMHDGNEIKIKSAYIKMRFEKLYNEKISAEKNKIDIDGSKPEHDAKHEGQSFAEKGGKDEGLNVENNKRDQVDILTDHFRKNPSFDIAMSILKCKGYSDAPILNDNSDCDSIRIKSPYGQVLKFESEKSFIKWVHYRYY